MDQRAELIEQPVLEECAIDASPAFQRELLAAEDGGGLLQAKRWIIALSSQQRRKKYHPHAVREVGVRNLLAQNGDDVSAADIVLAVMHPPRWIDSDDEFRPLRSATCSTRSTIGGSAIAFMAALGQSSIVFRPTIQPSTTRLSCILSYCRRTTSDEIPAGAVKRLGCRRPSTTSPYDIGAHSPPKLALLSVIYVGEAMTIGQVRMHL